MISVLDAMTVTAKQLPDKGITFREYITRAAKLCGSTDEEIEAVLILAEGDGIMADDIVKIGPNGTKIN